MRFQKPPVLGSTKACSQREHPVASCTVKKAVLKVLWRSPSTQKPPKKKEKNTTLTFPNNELFIRWFSLSFPFWKKLLHCFWTFAGILQRNRLLCLTRTKGSSNSGAAQLNAAIHVMHNTLESYKADSDKVRQNDVFCLPCVLVVAHCSQELHLQVWARTSSSSKFIPRLRPFSQRIKTHSQHF